MYLCTYVPMCPCTQGSVESRILLPCLSPPAYSSSKIISDRYFLVGLNPTQYFLVGFSGRIISDTYFLVGYRYEVSLSYCIRHIPNIFGSEIDVKSIFDRPTKCVCTMPIVVPEEIFLLALRQLLCPTKCAFPHCSHPPSAILLCMDGMTCMCRG